MKTLNVKPGSLQSEIQVPSSKSYANRALILAALAGNTKEIRNVPEATDVSYLIYCLEKVGIQFRKDEKTLFCLNSFPQCEERDLEIEVGEGGTTARFLAALLLTGKKKYRLVLGSRLSERPWDEFLQLASLLGAYADLTGKILTIQGPAKFSSVLRVDCRKTTQFATAFELLSFIHKFKVIPENMSSSLSYLRLTEKVIEDFRKNDVYTVPLDWSSASYPLAFAALNHEIRFPELVADPYQADSKFYQLLNDLGCVKSLSNGLTIGPSDQHRSVRLDASDCLDLVPTLAFFLSNVEGLHQLSGVENLVHKESDRLSEVIKLLDIFERETSYSDGTLTIQGKSLRVRKEINLVLPDDHRMVMAGTLFLRHHGGGTVAPIEAVAKSYPDFFGILLE